MEASDAPAGESVRSRSGKFDRQLAIVLLGGMFVLYLAMGFGLYELIALVL